jgi:hypothetical protein
MKTVADNILQTRTILQDLDAANGYRYPDSELLGYFYDGIQMAFSLRPDLRIGEYAIPIPDSYALTDPFPIPLKFFAGVSNYTAGRAETQDSEFAVEGRAAALMSSLPTVLVKGV